MKFQSWRKEQLAVKDFPDSVVAQPAGVFAQLTVTAFLGASKDCLFIAIWRT
jgi:hypothetical protein